jgi:SPP1 gp7 family putative phage head morphogenesis protein
MLARVRRRQRLARLRRLAPKHPPGPEARIRLAVAATLGSFHSVVKQWAKHAAEMGAPVDAEALRDHGRHLLKTSDLRARVAAAAAKTADSARKQVARAIASKPLSNDLQPQEDKLTGSVYDAVDEQMGASVERAGAIVDEWDGEDVEMLDRDLDDGLDGSLGRALASATLAFGLAFSDMNRETQEEAGVNSYAWISQKDSAVRSEHLALDGDEAKWSEPLLKAEDSSNGEDDYPGEDWNCRCVAAPVVDDQAEG